MTPSNQEIRFRLAQLARPVAGRIAEHRRREALARAVRTVWPWFLAAPIARFVLAFVGFDLPGPLAFLVLAPVAPAAVLILAILSREGERAGQREALILIDDKLGLADRMSTAAEFLARRQRSPLMEAAIHDAETHIAAVAERWVAPPPVRFRVGAQAFWMLFVMALLLGLPTWTPEWRPNSRREPLGADKVARLPEEELPAREPESRRGRDDVALDPRDESAARRATEDSEAEVDEAAEPEDGDQLQKRSSSAAGRSARTRTTGGGSASRGQASSQSQPSKTGEKGKEKAQRRNAKEREDSPESPRERREEKESGATVGRGSGRGSSKSPTATPWASKDQVTAKEEQELEDDEEVEDDFDESKARGGVQPQLRSRKPPVNRDLQIGFGGGRPNPMANGRGGAGPPKKQRGVAQLVLGVHFPDQISGKPNPGMSKITQEQIEPQPEAADPAVAAERGRRSAAIGHVARPRLLPWMQRIVRDYFSSSRPSF